MIDSQSKSLNVAVLLGFLAVVMAAPAAVDFEKEVAPILETKCLGCHTSNIAKGDVDLSSADSTVEYLRAGESHRSLLFQVIVPEVEGGEPEMPKEGEPLTDSEIKTMRSWIEEGAVWPEGLVLREASKADKEWWAYQPLKKDLPKSVNGNPIDGFIEAKLKEEGLEMNPAADPRTLIRRLSYDLIGLPPTMAEVRAFERAFSEDSDSAVRVLADQLLASKHYGERWGRHWLDVVRYGESKGYERNLIINSLWPFRDYVIKSINGDKPFDQLIREHLAGDVVGRGEPEVEIGSAFLVAGPYDDVRNQDAAQAAQIRANTLDEIINATGEAFLGMTLGCAKCHDHKFDPILQEDYYAMYATFAGVRHAEVPWATDEAKRERAEKLKPLQAEEKELVAEQTKVRAAILERAKTKLAEYEERWVRPVVDRSGTEERFAPVRAKFVRFVSEGLDTNPAQTVGFRVDEFEVWSEGEPARNVALASNGSKATGKAREIEDFPGAYGAHHAIDGKFGARFMSAGSDLTIELAKPEKINRVFFSSARNEETPEHRKFVFVAEYRIEVSMDGESWAEVANGRDRKPVGAYTAARNKPTGRHLDHRLLSLEMAAEEKANLAELSQKLAAVKREIASVPTLPVAWIGRRDPKDAEGPFHLFVGGNPQRPGAEVTPASLSTLDRVVDGFELPLETPEAERREQLAEWIVSPDNPLTWRVLANRLWHYHFGTGIVDTPNDFGYMGGRPTHPELLDFLAEELKQNGFRWKPLHRLIVTSRAYRQSSEWREKAASIDGDSRLLWRFPPRRLSAEEVRDTILTVAGKLDETMGGPGFRLYHFMQDNVCTYEPLDEHGPETYRRAVYHQNARASVVDLMTEFDQPDCAFSAPRRSETTTPLQALTLLNHSFTIDMAEALAGRVTEEVAGQSPPQWVRHAFQLAYQRPPTKGELAKSVALVEEYGLEAFSRALLNSSELIYCD